MRRIITASVVVWIIIVDIAWTDMRRIMTAAEVVGPIIGLIARMGFLSLGLVVRIPGSCRRRRQQGVPLAGSTCPTKAREETLKRVNAAHDALMGMRNA